ncbi:MAG: non-homologous end-joining DNA ligase [Motilibacteraceae bacterium]
MARDDTPDLRPMLATAGQLPPPAQDDRWAFEMKWDGVRAVVHLGSRLKVMTRNDREVAGTYPELAGLPEALGRRAVLDGEIVAVNADGRPDFGLLQQRMHVVRPARRLLDSVPVCYLVFDLLALDGEVLTGRPYAERRAALEALDLAGPHWATPPVFLGGGQDAMEVSAQRGLEGVVAKRVDSTYEPGRRSRAWIKVKHQRTQEVVVGGWKPGEGRRGGGLGAPLRGGPGPAGLADVGHRGPRITHAAHADVAARLAPLARATSPFDVEVPREHARAAQWVQPELVGEVVFTEWTRDGRLRHPVWRGWRPDKGPADVVREP